MSTLSQTLLADDDRREKLVDDCVKLIEQRVARRDPIRRIALSAGLGLLNAIKPNALPRAVGKLLPDFAEALEPLYRRFQLSNGSDFSPFLAEHSDEATAALIGVTDRRAESSENARVRSMYARLRRSAEEEVRAALPGLASIVSGHLALASGLNRASRAVRPGA